MAIALLGNTIPTGAILVVLITIFGPISGAHFNLAVTIAFLLRGEILPWRAVAYVVVQVVGGICGAVLAHLMFELPLSRIVEAANRCGTMDIGVCGDLWFAGNDFWHIAVAAKAVPMMVGLYITAAYWFTASTSFANPAVTIARSFTNTFSGIFPGHALGFIVAQLAAAVIGTYALRWLFALTR